MKGIYLDPDTSVIEEQFAVIYAPRRSRERFPESNVTVMSSRQAAIDGAQPDRRLFAARVVGPSRSSEGVKLYYVVDWLD
jgi:hypothetical protein